MSDEPIFFEVRVAPHLQHLFRSVCEQLEGQGIDPHPRWDEVAGFHAAGEKPTQSRKSGHVDDEGRAQFFITVFTTRFRYAVDEEGRYLWINKIQPPAW